MKLYLQFVRVLDLYEFAGEPEDSDSEPADRAYWENRASHESLAVVDSVKGLIPPGNGEPRTTYNKYHIAIGTTGYNFGWFYPRKGAHCHIEVRVGGEKRPEIMKTL